jgi:tRNA(adenine34) deaminase
MLQPYGPEYFMKEAHKQALLAYEEGEIPVGAVITYGSRIIARAYNQVEKLQDPTAHAEILAITSAAENLGSKYLEGCSIYVTLEPCSMCAGALFWSRFDELIFAAPDPKRGYRVYNEKIIHPATVVREGIMKDQCEELLKKFFKELRP